MSEESKAVDDDIIKVGKYVIIQRQEYTKLHKFGNITSKASLGREQVELENINECRYYTTFRMVPRHKGKQRVCTLEVADVTKLNLKEDLNINVSGEDNRNIKDDGQSQSLSTEQIQQLKEDAPSCAHIVSTLISNSSTFHSKTEYSQEKYLKKKQKKYYEYLRILKPSIRLISDIMYRQDPSKVLGLRCDTLSQLLSYSNVSSGGNHMLYDSGTCGLVAAALLNAIGAGTAGNLVHMHPGNSPQKQGLLAMNFPVEQLQRCVHVNLYSVLRHYYQADPKTNLMHFDDEDSALQKDEGVADNKRKIEKSNGEPKTPLKRLKTDNSHDKEVNEPISCGAILVDKTEENSIDEKERQDTLDCVNKTSNVIVEKGESNKHDNGSCETKKPRTTNQDSSEADGLVEGEEERGVRRHCWELENARACLLLRQRMDSLLIVCKEHPLPVFRALVGLVAPGRPFVIYHPHQEVLTDTYVQLRKMPNVVAVKLTQSWMRGYQVLPERTHPDVLMQANSGFLLSGWIVAN